MYFKLTFCILHVLIIPKDVSSLCLTWTSSADDIIRSHCYWYVELSKAVSFFEADDICASNGGRLAPFVDSWQYSIIENMRPYTTPDTFIGVIDIGKENTWTQLDGTKIDSSFTNTFDLNNNQPNGGKSQNCIVMDMEPHHYFRPDKTQDKSCFSSFKTTAMICYADKKEFCYVWMSVNDGKLREHCYWLTTKPRSSSRWNFIDALSRCTAEGGTLAPAIDEMQLAFIRETLTGIFQSPNATCTGVWMGSNTIRGYTWNWNNDPNFLSIPLGNLTPEKCLRLKKDTLDAAYISCNSDLSDVRGAVCFRNATGQILTTPTTTTPTTTTETHPLTTSTTSTTTTTTLPTTTSASTTTTPPTTSEVPGVLNLTYLEQVKVALTVDPKETSAFKATLNCAEDNRFVSKCMGYTGVAVISGIFVTILFLDVKLLISCR
ncbi:uncharacterized protein [Magallana gigas]|uniref:uncharacterized protein n=1 Tax=Magallana gigas TaxID=29159 RepID=UPI00333FBB7D